jgi:hypothetical protein
MIWRKVAVMIVVEVGVAGNCCTGWVKVMKSDLPIVKYDTIEMYWSLWSGGGTWLLCTLKLFVLSFGRW